MVTKRIQDITSHMNLAAISHATAVVSERSPQTPVGRVMKDTIDSQKQQKIIDDLTEKLEAAGNGELVRWLNPIIIIPGKQANRAAESFLTKEFADLKAEISHAGGNVQPIKVRPVEDGKFEIIYGHRRHQACLELGIHILAMIVPMDDQKAYIEMVRENKAHANLRPIEAGRMYKRALDDGLFPSIRKLAEAEGADHSNIAKAVTLASLPEKVLLAFTNQLDLKYEDATVLNSEVLKNPEGVIIRASQIMTMNPRPGHREVMQILLTGVTGHKSANLTRHTVKGINKQTAKIVIDPRKNVCNIEISNPTPELLERIKESIQGMIGSGETIASKPD